MADAPIEAKPLPPCAACGKHHGSVGMEFVCIKATLARVRDELTKERADHAATIGELSRVSVESVNKGPSATVIPLPARKP